MKDLKGYFTLEDIYNIGEQIELLRDQVLFRLLILTGRRVGEVLNLKVKDLMYKDGKPMILWSIEKKKLNKEYLVLKPIDEETIDLTKQYIELEELDKEDWLFPSPKNHKKHLTRYRVFQLTREYCKMAGIERVGEKKPHPHHFRHSFAIRFTRMSKNPADIRKLQMMLEHSSLGVTEQYLQFTQEDTRDLLERDPLLKEKQKEKD
jgi:integrase